MSKPRASRYAILPSIDRLLNSSSAAELLRRCGRAEVKRVAQNTLEAMRDALKRGDEVDADEGVICLIIEQVIRADANRKLRRVINLSGTVVHTNLGRALLPQASIDAVVDVMRAASNLEFDLESGKRGERDAYLEDQICRLTGAGKEVPVSRGELVEIGGSFRIPDIISRSGCTLVEVGTTNRTHLYDFETAIATQTGMILKVHQSNYVIEGFTAAVDERELSGLCTGAEIR